MSAENLIAAFGRLRSVSEETAKSLGSVRQAATEAAEGLDSIGRSSKDTLDEMLKLADGADISMWLKPMTEQLAAGKMSAEEFSKWLAQIRGEMEALAARGARPLLGDFEAEIQRLMKLLGELQGSQRGR